MKVIVRLFISFILIIIPVSLCIGQICYKFHENCIFADWEFYYSRQSASALFEPNQTSSLQFFAHGKEKYYISVCGDKKFKDIKFRILDEGNSKTVIYDNSLDYYNSSVTFINEESRNLIVEVTAPDVKGKKEDETGNYCIGVLIQFAELQVDLPEQGETGF